MAPRGSYVRSRIARRMLALFVACAVVPMTLLAAFTLTGIAGRLEQQAGTYLNLVCRDASRLMVDGLGDVDDELLALRELLAETSEAPRVRRAQLETWRGDHVADVALFRGETLVAASPDWSLLLPELTPEQRAHLASGEALVHFDRGLVERQVLLVLRQLVDGDGEELLLAGVATTDQVMQRYEFAQNDIELRLFLLGDEVLASTLSDETSRRLVLDGWRGAAGTSGRFEVESAGEDWLASHRTSFLRPRFGVDVVVISGIRADEVHGPVVYFQRLFVLLSLLSTCVAMLLAARHIRRYLLPLAALHEAAERVASGDYAVRTDIESGDEFEELSSAFDEMASCVLDRTAELERANKAKSDFLANVSHELRTPLTAILGYVDLCLEPDVSPEERTQHLRLVADSGQRLSAVIEDILSVANLESGGLEVTPQTCDVADLLGEVVRAAHPRAERKGLSLDVRCDGRVPARVRSEPRHVRLVLQHLVDNAIKFTETGGVVLSVSCAANRLDRTALAFEVRDSGCGIAPERIQGVFEPFSQLDGSRARRHGGAGLGLAVARQSARALGGDVRCTSEPGRGSVFTFTLDPGPLESVELLDPAVLMDLSLAPQEPPTADGPAAAALPAPQPSKGQRLLVVEDSQVNLRLLRAILEREGYRVDVAEDGEVGARKAAEAMSAGEPHDLVLTDIQMPAMDGYELVRLLRTSGYTGPVVALTAHSMAGERERCLAAGCDEFATKPIDRAELCALVERLIAGSGVGSEG